MKVRMLQSMRGPKLAHNPGDEVELSASEGARWCSKGIAAPIKARRKRAVKDKPEQAIIP